MFARTLENSAEITFLIKHKRKKSVLRNFLWSFIKFRKPNSEINDCVYNAGLFMDSLTSFILISVIEFCHTTIYSRASNPNTSSTLVSFPDSTQ